MTAKMCIRDRGEGDAAHLGSVRQAISLKLLGKETAAEDPQPFENLLRPKHLLKGEQDVYKRQAEDRLVDELETVVHCHCTVVAHLLASKLL